MASWDPIDIARRVVAGEQCRIGKWLVVFMSGNGTVFVQHCKRCSLQIRMSKHEAMQRMDEFAHFLHRHAHEEVRWS